ncbi:MULTISPECIES: GNAT family N-acetyltransferase [Sphingobacterium]|uniref:GNAT family N-acetyltransferase n=1 Tax=Sphingobacterium TaxID=28453 RepID=UPI0013D8FD5C|nr:MULTISPECIES: GNAT family protein [unclassified Sphingobacterium]
MDNSVYIRPLVLSDANISYRWRNDSNIWKFTEFKPDSYISLEAEQEWLKSKLEKKNERRFAICLKENNQYIGNIQLLNINNGLASFHIFIGEKTLWGKGIGQQATKLILKYAFSQLGLESVLLEVNKLNISACKTYERIGFVSTGTNKNNGFIKMKLNKTEFSL